MREELDLLRRARALDGDALTEIHNRYYGAVYRYISFRIDDVQTAEDLASEVFTRFLRAIRDRNAPQNSIQGWLYGTASHVVKEQYRKQKRSPVSELDESIPSPNISPEQGAEVNMTLERLRTALSILTDDQQHVLALRFGQGMPVRDVARLINKSEGSVKMLQVRAIAALTRHFQQAEVDR
ncbi:MAG: sigma-70 family RNA polymerase sigma factor [Saprospiraceae bacterium]|nr:sigma-70 family RNA polymerase sigma factor [Saprospiraceae bacterium]